jgi:hypothetical protein
MKFKFNKSSGQASRFILILAVIILIAAIIVYLVIKMAEKPLTPEVIEENPVVVPIYEQTLGNVKFIFISGINRGNTLYASDTKSSYYLSSKKTNLTTVENFIEVKIGAQNMGKFNLEKGSWDIENIVDSEGREFVPLEDYAIKAWLPEEDLCGSLLKPAFNPTPCVKIYEVSRKSTGLKIRVVTGKDNEDIDSRGKDNQTALIDLIITQ